jgi:hypothetical protein
MLTRSNDDRKRRVRKKAARREFGSDDDDVLDAERDRECGGGGGASFGGDSDSSVSSSESSFVDVGRDAGSDAGSSSFSLVGNAGVSLPPGARLRLVDRRIRASLHSGAFDPDRVRAIEAALREIVESFASASGAAEAAAPRRIDAETVGEGGAFARLVVHGVAQFHGLTAFSRAVPGSDEKGMWLCAPLDAVDAAALIRDVSLADHLAAGVTV